jgi:hypothetical protein
LGLVSYPCIGYQDVFHSEIIDNHSVLTGKVLDGGQGLYHIQESDLLVNEPINDDIGAEACAATATGASGYLGNYIYSPFISFGPFG